MGGVSQPDRTALDQSKFKDPHITAAGETRARVSLDVLRTLWINTGTLCNLTCAHCYIESSPRNDRLEYITLAEVCLYLDEIRDAIYILGLRWYQSYAYQIMAQPGL